MKNDFASGDLFIRPAGALGRGVFAGRAFKTGDVIERVPVIMIPGVELSKIDKTCLYDYYFKWGLEGTDAALALGYGSLYNHSFTPNATHHALLADEAYEFIALQDIEQGEEIRINYNGDPKDTSDMWFEVEE
jgi:SET domain-containing protein